MMKYHDQSEKANNLKKYTFSNEIFNCRDFLQMNIRFYLMFFLFLYHPLTKLCLYCNFL